MGATGLSVARFLSSMCISFQIVDSRETPPNFDLILKEFPDTSLFLGEFSMEIFEEFDVVIVSPGVSLNQPVLCDLKSHGVEVIGDLELFFKCSKGSYSCNYRIKWKKYSYNYGGNDGQEQWP
jgi:UDP-N-acetylmuramoylalanine--D-glutamate ligase